LAREQAWQNQERASALISDEQRAKTENLLGRLSQGGAFDVAAPDDSL